MTSYFMSFLFKWLSAAMVRLQLTAKRYSKSTQPSREYIFPVGKSTVGVLLVLPIFNPAVIINHRNQTNHKNHSSDNSLLRLSALFAALREIPSFGVLRYSSPLCLSVSPPQCISVFITFRFTFPVSPPQITTTNPP